MTDVQLSSEDEVRIQQAVRMLEMRRSTSVLAVLAADKRLKDVPERIQALAKERLEQSDKEKPEDPSGGLPSIDHLSGMEQILMTGVLEKTNVRDAVVQIYDNMHQLTNWKYTATSKDVNGQDFVKGNKSAGMCESYRNAFAAAVKLFEGLRRTHPVEAMRVGDLTIQPEDTLVNDRFCTRTGLTLMGGLKGNVYLEVDGQAKASGKSIDEVNRFVFKGHWSIKVNDVVYDPIFYSIGEDNIEYMLNPQYEQGDIKFIPNVKAPLSTGEFGATFCCITDWPTFKSTVDAMNHLYKANKKEVDDILAGTKDVQEGRITKTDRKSYTKAKQIAKDSVADKAVFRQVMADGAAMFKSSEITAVTKILDLASK
jgi:hypothetical protein